jgi:hypothetical protein
MNESFRAITSSPALYPPNAKPEQCGRWPQLTDLLDRGRKSQCGREDVCYIAAEYGVISPIFLSTDPCEY